MTTFSFVPATRETARARIGLQGPAGSGKTKSAIRIAEGLVQGGDIGIIDTERGSALTYAPVPGRPDLGGHRFLHLPLDNYDPRNLIEATRAAADAQLPALIVDSWSHFWNGKGGLLEIVDRAGSERGAGGTFGGWRTGNPIEQDMLEALLNYPGHVIVTMRTRGDYVIEGKKVTKVGVKAVQREGAEYELGLIIDMVEGTGTVTKTRYEPLEGLVVHHPGEELAGVILEQLGQGVDPVQQIIAELFSDGMTYQGAIDLHARAKQRGLLDRPASRPGSDEASTLGELIAGVGKSLRPAAVPAQAPPPAADPDPAAGANGAVPHSLSDAQAATDRLDVPTPATPPQMRKIHAALGQMGITDRTERLSVLGAIVGREIDSANELTKADAGEVIDLLDAALSQDDPEAKFREWVARTTQANAA
ncbi:AAA family ATPase [Kitasatospora sp. NPDC058406]|uniref:AAA family ATPase n=1 Tax=Kitasatospora sp. NPDC058406 TaxID=3346483 RepID=UPI00365C42C3